MDKMSDKRDYFYRALSKQRAQLKPKCICVHIHFALNPYRSIELNMTHGSLNSMFRFEDNQLGPASGMTSY